jgi:hypothetical protein
MDVTLIIFPVSLQYFEIAREKLTYIKLTQLAFQECKKHIKIVHM